MNIEICTLTRDIADNYIDYFGNRAFLMEIYRKIVIVFGIIRQISVSTNET